MKYNGEMTNKDRAERAKVALLAYLNGEGRKADVESTITFAVEEAGQDLICDLLHLVRQVCGPEEVGDILRRGEAAHPEEIAEEEAVNN